MVEDNLEQKTKKEIRSLKIDIGIETINASIFLLLTGSFGQGTYEFFQSEQYSQGWGSSALTLGTLSLAIYHFIKAKRGCKELKEKSELYGLKNEK